MSNRNDFSMKGALYLILFSCFFTGLMTRQYQIDLYRPLLEACEAELSRDQECKLIAVPKDAALGEGK
ncbi:MAG: hypothetical protein Unbinned7794contig1000_24 [Prokaryotic dsDNA virus sp.]|nr:MAG: hypothetical protein Unbinned7794contig1000_24 [Prokaryotic dsDNA virus sp.]|tara:strand:+ start:7398 stop:7601 length:204 start_codon:yes stop_codon:yes gene_type:complete